MPVTPSGRLASRVISNALIRRFLGFDHPPRDVRWSGVGRRMRVLEVGPGAGLFTRSLLEAVGPRGWVVGLEYSSEAALELYRLGRSRSVGADGIGRLSVVVGDASVPPFSLKMHFDAVCCFYSLEEVAKFECAAAALGDMVLEDGLFVAFFWRPLGHRRKRRKIAEVLAEKGFRKEAEWADMQNVRQVWRRISIPTTTG